MNESKWEPPAEMVEALAKELHAIRNNGLMENIASFVLRRQHERECGLLEALENISRYGDAYLPCPTTALLALERWEKLDAPKVPTLADAVEQIERECPGRVIATLKDSQAWTIIKLAAVEREENR